MNAHGLRLRPLGIDTQQEYVVYMHRDCHICRAEGFGAQTRLDVGLQGRHIQATLNVVHSKLLGSGEASLSNSAWKALGAHDGDAITVAHASTLDSMSAVRSKIYGHRLDLPGFNAIIGDISAGRYPDLHIAAFLSACAGGRLDFQETIDLTRAMVDSGEHLDWGAQPDRRQALCRWPARQPHHAHRRRHRGGGGGDHAQNLVTGDHITCVHGRRDGDADPRRS